MIVNMRIEQRDDYFGELLTLPVTVDSAATLAGSLESLNDVHSLTFSLDDVIRASTKYLRAETRDYALHDDLVLRWIQMMRWHIATFWTVRHADNFIAPKGVYDPSFPMDYTKPSGEMLAQGIALRVLEECGIGAQFMFFVPSGNKATPDFAFAPHAAINGDLAALDWGGVPIGLEARCRGSAVGLAPSDRRELANKKEYFRQTLGVYFNYAGFDGNDGEIVARIHLADPENEEVEPFNEIAAFLVVAKHFRGVTQRIGLYEEADILHLMVEELTTGRIPLVRTEATYPPQGGRRVISRTHGTRQYHGRVFNAILQLLRRFSYADLVALGNSDDVGAIYFFGLDDDVLAAIHHRDIRALRTFRGANERSPTYSTGLDGVILAADADRGGRAYIRRCLRNELKSARFVRRPETEMRD